MKLVFFICLFCLFNAHAGVLENALSSAWQTVSKIENQNLCDQPLEKHTSCSEVQKLLPEFNEKFFARSHTEAKKLALKIRDLYSECLDKRFSDCYPQNKSSIRLNDLNKMFKKLKTDPRFRYPNGGVGMCSYRAEALSYYLAEAGYKTKTIRIEHAPVLIAMNRDAHGNFTGEYDDYQGFHTLVAIDVNVRGKTIQYFLDPQYMEDPIPKDDYFVKTIGQNCIKTEKNQKMDNEFDLTKCYYFEDKQNNTTEDLVTLLSTVNRPEDSPFLSCGWASGSAVNMRQGATQAAVVTDKTIRCTNAETPKEFIGRMVTSSTPFDLILNTYLNYEQTLKEQLTFINKQIEMGKQNLNLDPSIDIVKEGIDQYHQNVQRKKQIENSLKSLDKTISTVRKNLKKE